MKETLVRSLRRHDSLSQKEVEILGSLPYREARFVPGADLVAEGSQPEESCLLLEGVAARYNIVSGGRRQISAVHIVGDFVDLHGFLLATMDHGVCALSDVVAAFIPHTALTEITEREPHLTRLLWLLTVVDAATHRQWITAAGRMAPHQQLARFLCELYWRLQAMGLIEKKRFEVPMNQPTLADALGLSVVHVNRTIQSLRRDGLIAWKGTTVTILDQDRLQHLGEFDPGYLNLVPVPR